MAALVNIKQTEQKAGPEPRQWQANIESDSQQWRPLVVHRWHENKYAPYRFTPQPESNGFQRPTYGSTPTVADIRAMAYRLWEADGRPIGRDHDFWFAAERELGLHDQPAYESRWDENGYRAA